MKIGKIEISIVMSQNFGETAELQKLVHLPQHLRVNKIHGNFDNKANLHRRIFMKNNTF